VDLRFNVAYLPQKTHLFYGTIAQNLRLASPLAGIEQLEDALLLANVYDEVMALPRGLDTRIKDHSKENLSASFVQRLVLARAYLKDASIMILDEPESSLDNASDVALCNAVRYFRGKRTIFLVTHRPSHIDLADRVLYLEQGQLFANGPPQEIMPKVAGQYL